MKPRYVSALSNLILIVPDGRDPGLWLCVSYSGKSGHWRSFSRHETEAGARARRAELMRLHRKLAKEDARRKGK